MAEYGDNLEEEMQELLSKHQICPRKGEGWKKKLKRCPP